MRQRLASFLEDNFELLSTKATVFESLERRVTTEHFEIKMLPLLANSGEDALAFFDSQELQNDFKNRIFNSAPSLITSRCSYHSLFGDITLK